MPVSKLASPVWHVGHCLYSQIKVLLHLQNRAVPNEVVEAY